VKSLEKSNETLLQVQVDSIGLDGKALDFSENQLITLKKHHESLLRKHASVPPCERESIHRDLINRDNQAIDLLSQLLEKYREDVAIRPRMVNAMRAHLDSFSKQGDSFEEYVNQGKLEEARTAFWALKSISDQLIQDENVLNESRFDFNKFVKRLKIIENDDQQIMQDHNLTDAPY
jgi:soluble cytochrome b562